MGDPIRDGLFLFAQLHAFWRIATESFAGPRDAIATTLSA
jgi:hypothetical protein